MSEDMHYRYDPKKGYVACTAAEAWDSEEREKTMELGNAYVAPVKKLLTDTSTRFDHINDLLDYLNDGLVAVENSLERYDNVKDAQRKKRLEGAIALVNIYRDQLANLDGHKWDLNNLLDKCVPERGVLEAIRKARIEPPKALPPTPEDDNLLGV